MRYTVDMRTVQRRSQYNNWIGVDEGINIVLEKGKSKHSSNRATNHITLNGVKRIKQINVHTR